MRGWDVISHPGDPAVFLTFLQRLCVSCGDAATSLPASHVPGRSVTSPWLPGEAQEMFRQCLSSRQGRTRTRPAAFPLCIPSGSLPWAGAKPPAGQLPAP